MWYFFVLYFLLFNSSLGDLVVQLKSGKVRGTVINTPSGRTFYAWRGIPFAKPPLGKLRFFPPQKAEPWSGVLDASRDSPACIFIENLWADPFPTNGNSEDCLYINVYSPVPGRSISRDHRKLPVLFWIYGGGFFTGTGDFAFTDPTPFLEENVIVVTFNYRLSTFGFLSTEDDVLLGNAGLKDQLLALKWTKENIASFGGNPRDVTIFGESAGSGSVGYHILSPKSRGLFKGAIMQSGSVLLCCFEPAREFAYSVASQIDTSITKNSTSIEVLEVLQGADAELLVNLTRGKRVGPVFEIQSDKSFLTGPMYESLEAGNFSKVPLIIGYNAEESISFFNGIDNARSQAAQLDANPELLVPNMPLKENSTSTRRTVGEEIRRFYVGQNGSFANNIPAFLDWFSDNIFIRGTHKQAILQSEYSPVYMYQFSYDGTLSENNTNIPGVSKVGHTNEIGYMFNVSTRRIKTKADYLTRKRLVKLWTNFAKTLNPTPCDNSEKLLQHVKWEPITKYNIHYLDIDDKLEIKLSQRDVKTLFWDYLWNTYANHPYNSF